MKVKVYEKVSPVKIWFFIVGGILVGLFTIRTLILQFSLGSLLFGGIFSIGLLWAGIDNLIKKRKGELNETVYECERYEVEIWGKI